MTIAMLATTLTTALPPPPGAIAHPPPIAETVGKVERLWAFDGFYRLPPAVARVHLNSHLTGRGWRPERTVELGRAGQSTIVAWTNSTERLVATLTREAPLRTGVRYRIETRASAETPTAPAPGATTPVAVSADSGKGAQP